MWKTLTAWLAGAALAVPAVAAEPAGPTKGRRSLPASESDDSDPAPRAPRASRGSRGEQGAEPAGRSFERRGLPSWTRRGMEESGATAEPVATRGRRASPDIDPSIERPGRRPGLPDLAAEPAPRRAPGPKIVTPPPNGGATAPATRVGDARQPQHREWSRHWRDDHRYDWRDWRTRNRSLFRLGIYLDPYGLSYRRWMVGWSMRPFYYRSVYWIDDPWRYRLPATWGPYQWVRYHDDALLVNTWSGEVVDVIYNFFW